MTMTTGSIRARIEGAEGFNVGLSLSPDELTMVRLLIRAQWLSQIERFSPGHVATFRDLPIDRYHEKSSILPHDEIWRKINRIWPADFVKKFRETSLVKRLEQEWGVFGISDEENLGYENIYWRLVRPGRNGDIGSLHADKWFWDLDKVVMPPNTGRVKVWIAIHCEPGMTGLRVVPGSHKKEWAYHGFDRDGRAKPQLDVPESELDLFICPTRPGESVVFNDQLLHGGAAHNGALTRVSMEFTMFVKQPR